MRPALWLALIFLQIPPAVFADDDETRSFDVPAGPASDTLKQFALEADREIMFPAERVEGIRTHAVHGRFTVQAALDRLLAGTPLFAAEDEKTGALAVARNNSVTRSPPAAPTVTSSAPKPTPTMKHHKAIFGLFSALLVSAASAQTTGAASTTATAGEQANADVIQMSQFEVTTTQGHGYKAPTSAAAFKTNEEMMNIPQGVVVVTKDFIDDLHQANSSDILRYFGVAAKFFGDTMLLRGSNTQVQPWVDDVPVKGFFSDSAMFDSYAVIKGPAQALYLGAGNGGLVLETTKKPLPYEQNIIQASSDQYGLFRVTLDSTGPVGKVGESTIGYRLVAAFQDGKQYFTDGKNYRAMIMPQFNVQYKGLTVRVYFEMLDTQTQQGMALITPQGKLYTGSGWKNSDNRTAGYAPDWATSNLYGEALEKISDNWETKIAGSYYKQHVYGKYFSPTAANFDTQQETWIDRVANERWDYWTALVDAQGHYNVGPSTWEMASRDNFGFNFSNWTDKQAYWQTTPFPYPNGPIGGKLNIPFGQTSGTVLAPPSAFQPPSTITPGATSGLFANVTQDAIYWQHEIDVIPNWLTLLGDFTWANIITEQVANWGALPYQSVHTPGQLWVHRFGAVVHITKEVSLYALESTNFSTPLGTLLENAQLAPNQVTKGDEVGIKWNLMGGKLTGEAASYKATTTNGLNTIAGFLPNGLNFAAVIGTTVLKGVDGDFAFQITPDWQLIGQFYKGTMRDPLGNPVSLSWESSFGLFTRYNFREGGLKGLAIGGGVNRLGGRWVASSGSLIYNGGSTTATVPAYIKLEDGTEAMAFAEYHVNKHWSVSISCANLLNKAYVANYQSVVFSDPSTPRNFTFATTFKF